MKDYRKHVERILYNYPALLAAVEVEPLQIAAGADPGEMTALKATKQKQAASIERALQALNFTERDLIKLKYFDPEFNKDYAVYEQLGMGSTAYYKMKEQALRKMAIALNVI